MYPEIVDKGKGIAIGGCPSDKISALRPEEREFP
jgi:hypothetical protein